jgi:hypothetical protein
MRFLWRCTAALLVRCVILPAGVGVCHPGDHAAAGVPVRLLQPPRHATHGERAHAPLHAMQCAAGANTLFRCTAAVLRAALAVFPLCHYATCCLCGGKVLTKQTRCLPLLHSLVAGAARRAGRHARQTLRSRCIGEPYSDLGAQHVRIASFVALWALQRISYLLSALFLRDDWQTGAIRECSVQLRSKQG